MASPIRILQTNQVYHIYNRGNRREPIFRDPYDKVRFLEKAFEYALQHGVKILAYCLMTNHFHFLLLQEKDGGVEGLMRALGISTSKFYNWQYGQVGHLFQERYQDREIQDDADLINTAAYIHFNPADFTNYETYKWSDFSIGNYAGRQRLLQLLDMTELGYREYVAGYAIKSKDRQTTSEVGAPIG